MSARALTKRELQKLYPTCGCVFCDLELPVYSDSNGPYHDGPEDTRIPCNDKFLRSELRAEAQSW